VMALDFDPESIRVARANAKQNRVSRTLQLLRADLTQMPLRSRTRHDFICANLIAPLLLTEGWRLVNRLKPGGRLVLAGILRREFPLVQACYRRLGLKFIGGRSEKEWRSGAFVRE
jgi:ribosomal protein L11 methyltransferase